MIYITLIAVALLSTYLVRFTVKEIKQHICLLYTSDAADE